MCLAKTSVCFAVLFGFVIGQRTIRSESVLASHWELDEGTGTTTKDLVKSYEAKSVGKTAPKWVTSDISVTCP